MVDVLQFIFGGTVLWGIPRFAGTVILMAMILGWLLAVASTLKKK